MVSLTLPARIGRRRHSPIRHIDGGAIYPRHGGVVGLYRVGGVDVLGQAPAERDATVATLLRGVCALDHPWQAVARSLPADLAMYGAGLVRDVDDDPNATAGDRRLVRSFADWLAACERETKHRSRTIHTYLAFPAATREELEERASGMEDAFAGSGLRFERLEGLVAARVYHEVIRQRQARHTPITGAELRGYRLHDYLAPDGTERDGRSGDVWTVDGVPHRTLSLGRYPARLRLGWLLPLLRADGAVSYAVHGEPIDDDVFTHVLDTKYVQLDTRRLRDERAGNPVDRDVRRALRSIERLQDDVGVSNRGCYLSIFLTLAAPTLEGPHGLNHLTEQVKRRLRGRLATTRPVVHEPWRGVWSTLPLAHNQWRYAEQKKDAKTAVLCLPFISRTVSKGPRVVDGRRPWFWGFGMPDGEPIFYDPRDPELPNGHIVVPAPSGNGKTVLLEGIAERARWHRQRVRFFDPKGDARRVTAAAGGERVPFTLRSGRVVNACDVEPLVPKLAQAMVALVEAEAAAGIRPGQSSRYSRKRRWIGKRLLADQFMRRRGLFDLLLAERPGAQLTLAEHQAIEAAQIGAYREVGITADALTHLPRSQHPAGRAEDSPLLTDVARHLEALGRDGDGDAAALARRLRATADGVLAPWCTQRTNVDLSNPFLHFEFVGLPESLWPLALHLLAGFLWREMLCAGDGVAIFDELWRILTGMHRAGHLFAELWRLARSYGWIMVGATQGVSELVDTEHGRVMWENSGIHFPLRQPGTSVARVAQLYDLSEAQVKHIQTAPPGHPLMIVNGQAEPIYYRISPDEYRLMTTRRNEVEKIVAEQALAEATDRDLLTGDWIDGGPDDDGTLDDDGTDTADAGEAPLAGEPAAQVNAQQEATDERRGAGVLRRGRGRRPIRRPDRPARTVRGDRRVRGLEHPPAPRASGTAGDSLAAG